MSILNSILGHIRRTSGALISLIDPVILQALLTSLIAGDSHLILRTQEEDIGIVARLVVWTLSSVFQYSTHRLKIRPKSSPTNGASPPSTNYFLKSLFLPVSSSSSGSNYTSQDESSDANKSRKLKSRHSRTMKQQPHVRQADAGSTSQVHLHVDPNGLSNVLNKSPNGHHVKSNAPIATHTEPGLHHHCPSRNNTHPGNKPLPRLPRALVISGLENASTSSQRALAQVLAEKQILFDIPPDGRGHQVGQTDPDADEYEGVWNLPEGFIAVYVCPIDPRERPNIHNSLLDKFAMSCNVLIKPSVRHAMQSIPFSPTLGRTNLGAHSNPSTPLASSHISLPAAHAPPFSARPPPVPHRTSYNTSHPSAHSHSHSHSGSHLPTLSSPVLPSNLIHTLQQTCTKTYLSPTLTLYLADLFSATRHHAELDGTLLTARCVHDAEKLARAARVVGVDPTGLELLRGGEDEENQEQEQDADVDEENSDEQWQAVGDEYETTGVASSLHKSVSSIRDGRIDPQKQQPSQDSDVAVLDVTEVNIARMFPRCVSHRLRVRDGPREEVLAGAVFGATFGDLSAEEFGAEEIYVDAYEVRPTVKDILVNIMSEV